ncbi:MAG: class I SAM-dependent methyltransferase [Bdellovibrionota bacterium]
MFIEFNPNDPFPLYSAMDYNYEDAKSHSRQADLWLKLKTHRTEKRIQTRLLVPKTRWDAEQNEPNESLPMHPEQEWSGLAVQTLMTPYWEIRSLLNILPLEDNQHIVDLGCAYARMGHVIGTHYPSLFFTGYEISSERVTEAQRILKRFDYPRIEVVQQDLSDPEFAPVPADYYFIYDFGTSQSVQKSLNDLKKIATSRRIQVIARGGISRNLIFQRHSWLCDVHPPKNYSHFSIFRS